MKRKITLLFIAASAALSMNSQVVLSEDFTSPFTLNAATGWTVQNNSAPTNTLAWFQGNGSGVFPAYNGGANDYYGCNFNSTTGAGDISDWLISPTVTIQNGAVFQFATRVPDGAVTYADRLQVWRTTGSTFVLGSGSTSTPASSTLLFDVNPTLGTSTVGTVVNSTATVGYPNVWTVYTIQITGQPTPVVGRFAFRYFVTNGGPNGANSSYIGVDAVKYTFPCIMPTITSYTACQNTAVTLNATGGLPTTIYSWTNTANSNTYTGASITTNANGTMGATDTYSVEVFSGSTSCGIYTTAVITTSNAVSMSIVASATNLCSGDDATLTVMTAANNYTWSTGAQTQSIVVSPNTNTIYTINSGAFGSGCTGNAAVNINVLPVPLITSSVTNLGQICTGMTFSISLSGGTLYLSAGSGFSATNDNPIVLTGGTGAGPRTYTVLGQGTNGCVGVAYGGYTVNNNPTVTIAPKTPTFDCVNTMGSLNANGANTYTWSSSNSTMAPITSANATMNPVQYQIGTYVGSQSYISVTYSVTGTDANGCVSTPTTVVRRVYLCTGLENINGNAEMSVYPNPFTNELKVESLIGRVEIYNALGQTVMNVVIKENGIVNTADLAKGVYILKAFNEQGQVVKTTRLMKN